jgi:hypothetical protein
MSVPRPESNVNTTLMSPYASYAQLMAMLGRGWEVEGPVHVRPSWRCRSGAERTYYFIVSHGDKVSTVSVLDGPEVRAFLQASKLAVDAPHEGRRRPGPMTTASGQSTVGKPKKKEEEEIT